MPIQSLPGVSGPRTADHRGQAPASWLDDPEIPSGVRGFCDQNSITGEVQVALDLARQHFHMIGKPTFEVVDDPEYGVRYLVIDILASGESEDVFQQGITFSRTLRNCIDRVKYNLLNIVYHAV